MGQSNEKARAFSDHQSNDICNICLEKIEEHRRTLSFCQHSFHDDCLRKWFQTNSKMSCPNCGRIYGNKKGQQPSNGSMTVRYLGQALPGFENDSYECPSQKSIEIVYSFPGGIQRGDHPSPGQPYAGTRRTAYLPNNDQGKVIVELLRRAFDDQQVFRIGRSITTGRDNSIIWNDIHHKTSIFGGPSNFGYPDETYLVRVRQELLDQGYGQ